MVTRHCPPRSVGVVFCRLADDIWQSVTPRYAVGRDGRRFWVTNRDRSLGLELATIVAERRQAAASGRPVPALIRHRRFFRRVVRHGRIEALFKCFEVNDRELIRLAIWLMSRMHLKSAIVQMIPFAMKADVRLRREVARALRRLGAWSELRAIAQFDPDPRVQQLAASRPAKPFATRFQRFAGDVPEPTAPVPGSHRTPLFFRERAGPGRAPRAPESIRAILERIRLLVRGR